MKSRQALIALLPTLFTVSCADDGGGDGDRLLVRTRQGTLRGVLAGPVDEFLGIPFAAPPVGDLRFQPPAPPTSWVGERDASRDLLDTVTATTTAHAYELDDPGFVWGQPLGPVPTPNGASHNTDLAYLFDFFGGASLSAPFTPAQQALADDMIRAWGAFIINHDPNAEGTLAWPEWEAATHRMLKLEPAATGVFTDFAEQHHCDFWRSLATDTASSQVSPG